MNKTSLGLIAVALAAASAPAAATGTAAVLNPRSVAELLEPISQPVQTLATLDTARQLEGVEFAEADMRSGPLGVVVSHDHHHPRRSMYHYYYHHHNY